jgi:hypothetical protein
MKDKFTLSRESRAYAWGFSTGIFLAVIVLSIGGRPFSVTSNSSKTSASTDPLASANCPPRVPSAEGAALLPPPEFADSLPSVIEATRKGEAQVAWKAVPKALSYVVVLTDHQGRRVNFIKTPFTKIILKDLRTQEAAGESHFFVSVGAVNVDGKSGEKNSPREIVAKDRPDITAPTIKSIKTED